MRSAAFTSAEISVALFGPGELEDITGFPQHLQRLWRSRGHLSEKAPHKRSQFNARDVAELYVRYLLAIYCVSPARSRSIGHKAAPMIFWAALLNTDGACEVIGPEDHVHRFLTAFQNDHGVAAELANTEPEFSRFLWSGDGSTFDFAEESDEVFASNANHSYVFLDLEAMANTLGQRAGKPLVTVRFPLAPDERPVRKLTKGTS